MSDLVCGSNISRPQNCALAVENEVEVFVPLEGLVDVYQEKKRLEKEIQSVQKDIKKAETKLAQKEFLKNAPPAIVEKEKDKLVRLRKEEEKLEHQLRQFVS